MEAICGLPPSASGASPELGFPIKSVLTLLEAVIKQVVKSIDGVLDWLPVSVLHVVISLTAGLLQRMYALNLCEYRISYDLTPYGDLAILTAFAPSAADLPCGDPAQSVKVPQADVVLVHLACLHALLARCPRDPRWHCAQADISVNPIVLQKLSSAADFKAAVRSYLVAASLATNFFADPEFAEVIDHGSLSYCLVKLGAHVAAAVLYQTFPSDEIAYGLRILHLNVDILTQLIQCPELNASNPVPSKKDMEQRILRSYFRELCRLYLVPERVHYV
ncbi:hypothetical protein DYB28_002032 [Aphanomyces astaci]|uniref:Uncharacterized protein n=1 Tax=Aphanomyces astaci TaxID=112090 RepID=A0A9X8DZ78_APHAT|nr:hypothetical protein DYB28_002032 [Aphanomyces astaci]